MNQQEWLQIKAIVADVLSVAPAQRQQYLLKVCKGDERLLKEVKAHLCSIDESGEKGFMSNIKMDHGAFVEDLSREWRQSSNVKDLIGQKIGSYEIIELLDSGGMGAVFKAERADGSFHQTVAIKLLKQSVISGELVSRFKQEQEILARLTHPNIAHLYDGGVTSDGVPYLIMEFVDGGPIDVWCDKKRCSVAKRLQLFKKVCEAIQFAHQNMVVHRDLKPQNIFVSNTGQVKMLDFGIAKLLDPDQHGLSAVETGLNVRLMSLAYAAPEQITGGLVGVHTDVYSLGMLLYILLAGLLPFDFEELPSQKIEQIIKDVDSPSPSRRLAELTDSERLAEISECPSVRLAQLIKILRGDLDAIILKALRKESSARYNSVERFKADVVNYLKDRPVQAREKVMQYRMKKFMRRHRWGITATAIVFISLIGGLSVALWQANVAAAERDEARLQSKKAETVVQYLTGLFRANDPSVAQGDTITVREVLERGVERTEALENQPKIQAALLRTTGEIYLNLGELKRAETLYQGALTAWEGVESPNETKVERAKALFGLAITKSRQGRTKEAKPLLREVINLLSSEEAYNDLRLNALVNYYNTLHWLGQNESADSIFAVLEPLLTRPALTPDVRTAMLMFKLGRNLGIRGKIRNNMKALHRGEKLIERAMAVFKEKLGGQHPMVGRTLHAVGVLLRGEMELDPGNTEILATLDSVSREELKLYRTIYSQPDISLFNALLSRSDVLQRMKRYDEAEKLIFEALPMLNSLEEKGIHRTFAIRELAQIAFQTGDFDEAVKWFQKVREGWAQQYGNDYLFTLAADLDLSKALILAKRYQEAETILLPTYKSLLATRGNDDGYTREALARLVNVYEKMNKPFLAAKYQDKLAESGDK